jgi:hypothetical protein
MSHQTKSQRSRLSGWTFRIGSALFLALIIGLPAGARNANDQLCFPSTVWFGAASPTVTQGYNPSDAGWTGAFQYVFGSGTSTPNAIVQGIRDSTNTNLYIAVQVNNLSNWDPDSAVVLAFDPDGTNAHMQMLVIYPIKSGVTNTMPYAAQEVDFYHGFDPTNGWGSVGTATDPTWAQVYTNFSTGGGTATYQWNMAAQLAIDATGNNGIAAQTTAPATFGFYANVLAFPNEPLTDQPGSVPAVPYAWPTDAPVIGAVGCTNPATCIFTQPNTLPASSTWGNSTINPSTTCKGVSITSQVGNIYTNQGMAVYEGINEPVISTAPAAQNIFFAYVQNNMVDSSGNPAPAPGITGKFLISDYGIPGPGDWIVPGTETGGNPIIGNGVAGPINIPATGCQNATNAANTPPNNTACVLNTGAWVLNSYEQGIYAHSHHCVQVQIAASSMGSNTNILNNTAAQNMNFESASSVERAAAISAKGYPLPAGMTDQAFDLGITTQSATLGSKRPDAVTTGGQGIISQLTWEVHGCRHTNTFLSIRQKRIEICQSVGGFGLIVHHAGSAPVNGWNQALTGSNLVKVKDNVYSIHVPQNGVAQVSTKIVPVEKGKGGLCGANKGAGAAMFLSGGLILIGFAAYRSRKEEE